ncbi:DUF5994 family protein [Flindersiella endophytica]
MRDTVEPAVPDHSPPAARLRLLPTDSAPSLLDGGWWPCSYDPSAELRQLILAIDDRHLPIARVILGTADWGNLRPRMLRIDGPAATRVIRLRWFDAMPAGLLIAICSDGRRINLLTVPPYTNASAAWSAMERSARADNQLDTPGILYSLAEAGPTAQIAQAVALPVPTPEDEGGF